MIVYYCIAFIADREKFDLTTNQIIILHVIRYAHNLLADIDGGSNALFPFSLFTFH